MPSTIRTSLAVAALALAPIGAARAQTIPFTGTRTAENIAPAAPNAARCGGPPNVLIDGIAGVGTSNLGAFATVESNCLNPATGSLFGGLFTFRFGDGSTFFGTGTGTVVLPPIGGVAPNAFVYVVTGGTGRFAGATGRLESDGQVRFGPDGTTSNTFAYRGTITTVPEPSTVLLVGAGLVGLAGVARRRRGISAARCGAEAVRRGGQPPSTPVCSG